MMDLARITPILRQSRTSGRPNPAALWRALQTTQPTRPMQGASLGYGAGGGNETIMPPPDESIMQAPGEQSFVPTPDPSGIGPVTVPPGYFSTPAPGRGVPGFFDGSPMPGRGTGSNGPGLREWWNNLPWRNQMQWAPEQGDPYANGEFQPPGEAGAEGEPVTVRGQPVVRGHGPVVRPGNLAATASAAARSGVRGDGTGRSDGAQFGGAAQDALLMWYQGMHQPTNLRQGDSPTRFQNGTMELQDGVPTLVGGRDGSGLRPTAVLQNSAAGIDAYNRAVAAALAASGAPRTGGGGPFGNPFAGGGGD